MNQQTRDAYRETLLNLRERLTSELQGQLDALPELMQAPGDISSVPTHRADHDSEGLETEVATGQARHDILENVNAALRRLDEGTFGVCQHCGKEIARERLEALPYTPYCVECARLPVEE